ncbi:MAG TPA: exodeoxyribonuclease VII small subunit [Trichocoleus sp.]|jgi:exodeoxyribonuclease VII small subunit
MNDLPEPSVFTSTSGRSNGATDGTLLSQWNYEQTVAEIEGIIYRIERGELELAEVFAQFAIAVEHLRHCENFLTRQQQQVDLLIETLVDETEPF